MAILIPLRARWRLLIGGLLLLASATLAYVHSTHSRREGTFEKRTLAQRLQRSPVGVDLSRSAGVTRASADYQRQISTQRVAAVMADGAGASIPDAGASPEVGGSRGESVRLAATNRPAGGAGRRGQWQAQLETLKETDPERYKAVLTSREELRRKVEAALAERAAYFLNADTSSMSEEEQQTYSQMLQLLDEVWRLNERLRGDVPPDERQDLRFLLRQDMQTLEPMLQAQRAREWSGLGLQLGYNQEDAQAFADYLNRIIDLTSMRGLFQNMRPGPPTGDERQNFAQTLQSSLADKAAYLAGVDAFSMTVEERQNYDKMLQLLDTMRGLAGRMSADLSPDERRELGRAMRQNSSALEPMLAAQRDKDWYGLGVQLGYQPDDARALANYLNKIADLTSMSNLRQSMRAGTFGDILPTLNSLISSGPGSGQRQPGSP